MEVLKDTGVPEVLLVERDRGSSTLEGLRQIDASHACPPLTAAPSVRRRPGNINAPSRRGPCRTPDHPPELLADRRVQFPLERQDQRDAFVEADPADSRYLRMTWLPDR